MIVANFGLRGWRWHLILHRAGVPHRQRDAYGLTLVGYMGNNVLPARGGELLKIGLLGQRTTARRREILGTVLVERVLDAAVLIVLLVAITWAGVEGAPGGRGGASLAAAGLLLAAAGLAGYLGSGGVGGSSGSRRRSGRSRARSRSSPAGRASRWRC